MSSVVARVGRGEIVDNDAVRIGVLYEKARNGIIGSVQDLTEAGQLLEKKKEELGHGEWLPWLEENDTTLESLTE
jgi:hypothetical protein